MSAKHLTTLLLFFYLMSSSIISYAQLDSLRTSYEKSESDSSRIATLIKIAQHVETVNFDSALYYYNQALGLAKSEGVKRTIPRYEGVVLENIGFAYIYGQQNMPEGIAWMKKALTSHQQASAKEDVIKTTYNIGFMYTNSDAYDSAVSYYNLSIEQDLRLGTKLRLDKSYNNLGLLFYYQGKYQQAAGNLLKAVTIKEELGNTTDIHHVYGNLGLVFNHLGEYERAKKYHLKALAVFRQENNQYGIALTTKNYADCLVKQDSLTAAREKYKEALVLYQNANNKYGLVDYYKNMGHIAYIEQKYQAWHDYLLQAEDAFYERLGNKLKMSIYGQIAQAKLLLIDSAGRKGTRKQELLVIKGYAQQAWEYAEAFEDQDDLLNAASSLATVYEQLGDYKQAFHFSKKQAQLSEETNNAAKTRSMAEMMTKYETEQTESENKLLKEKQLVNEANLRQQQLVIATVVIVAILSALAAFMIYRSRVQVQKAKKIAEKSLSEKELLLKEIHHRVKNNLQVISSLLDLQARGIEDENALSVFLEGQNRVKAMSLIHQRLYQNENLASIGFKDYAVQLVKELEGVYRPQADIKCHVNAKGPVDFDIDTAIPLGLILNELISNAYKYAFEGRIDGEINISITEGEEGGFQMIVEDNGIGLPLDFNFQKAKSLGLRLVRRLSKQLYGKAIYSKAEGAKFVIQFSDLNIHKLSS